MRMHRSGNILVVFTLLLLNADVQARGWGGYRGGSYSGYHSSSYSGYRSSSYGGYRSEGSYSGSSSRSYEGSYGSRSGSASSSYDRSYTGSRGGSYSAEGSRGATWGSSGFAAGGTRSVSATGAEGRTYTGGSREGVASGSGGTVAGGSRYGVASGPGGTVAGGSRYGMASGAGGTVAGGSRWGGAFSTDSGLARYSSAAFGGVSAHSTQMWSSNYMTGRAGFVRTGFASYGSFSPTWYSGHPAAWGAAVGWHAGNAWSAAAWPSLASWVSIPAAPVYYDYGNTVIYQGGNVYVNGSDAGTADEYNQQAITLASQGQAAKPPETDKWQALGVFSLVQGDEKSSNTLFQLAVDSNGVIRGNYYDALMDSTTPVYGSVDKTTQRAAWTIGDKKDTVFETGIFNLTKEQTAVLVHFGKDRTQQWLLVRQDKPKTQP